MIPGIGLARNLAQTATRDYSYDDDVGNKKAFENEENVFLCCLLMTSNGVNWE